MGKAFYALRQQVKTLPFDRLSGKIIFKGSKARIYNIKEKYEPKLLQIENVQGVGVGRNKEGKETIKVYVKKGARGARKEIPERYAGFPVEIVEIGDVRKA